MATIFFGSNENPQEFATDALAQAQTLSAFEDGVGSSVFSLESGLYYLDSDISDQASDDLSLDDGTGLLRKSDKQNIFMKDNNDISGLNLPASGDALPNTQILVGNASNDATPVAMSNDATIANTGALTIANDAIITVKILDDNVTTAKLAALAVTAAKIGPLAVETAKIDDLAVTAAKLGALAVTTAKIDDLAVTAGKLGALSVETAKLDALAVTTAKITDGNVTQVKIAANALDGTVVANLGDASLIGGVTLTFTIETAGGVTADVDVVMTHKVRILDVEVINKAAGTASDTITVKNGSTAITDAIDISGADKTVARQGTNDVAQATISASGTLKITETDGGGSDSPATTVVITAVRVA